MIKIDNEMTVLKNECVIIENKIPIIICLFLLIVLVIVIFTICPVSLLSSWNFLLFILLFLCSTLVFVVRKMLYESFFIIDEFGFSYGKRQRYKEKKVIQKVDYDWMQIKELYFERTTALHTILFLVVVYKNGLKNTIGISLLPLTKKRLKNLIIRFSGRKDIFKK